MMAKAPAISIDLGTTSSRVAVFQNDEVVIIANEIRSLSTPSFVAFADVGCLIGDAAEYRLAINPTNTIYNVKRFIGRKWNDPIIQKDMAKWPFRAVNNNLKPNIQVNYKNEIKSFAPEEICGMVLNKMKSIAEKYLDQTVTNAVITVPSNFTSVQRQAIKDAGVIAGLNVLQVMNEQTAAAIAYGLHENSDRRRNILIFDLGGGSLDVSVISINDGHYKVKATAGYSHLGGQDFDNRLVNHFAKEFQRIHKKSLDGNQHAYCRLRIECEGAKKKLSDYTETSIQIDSFFESNNFSASITRARFEELNADLFAATMILVEQAIRDSKMEKTDIDDIVLVGGSTCIPKIRQLLRSTFDGKQLYRSDDSNEAVVYGAAVQAAILNGDKSAALPNITLLDATPLSLNITTGGDVTSVIINRSTSMQTTNDTEIFSTIRNNQSSVTIAVLEGNRETHTLTIDMDSDGILNVNKLDKFTNTKNRITISDDCLSQEDIERMVNNAERYRAEEKKLNEAYLAKKSLQTYCNNMKIHIINDLAAKITDAENTFILDKCNETIKWSNANRGIEVEEYKRRQKDLEAGFQTVLHGSADRALGELSGASPAKLIRRQ